MCNFANKTISQKTTTKKTRLHSKVSINTYLVRIQSTRLDFLLFLFIFCENKSSPHKIRKREKRLCINSCELKLEENAFSTT